MLTEVAPQVSIVNFHYALPESVTWNLGLNRPLAFDETGFAGPDDSLYRRQAWRFLMAGGAVFNGLDYSFAVGFEKGTAENDAPGGGSAALRSQLGVLKRTLEATGLVAMRPDSHVVKSAPGATTFALSEPGRQYLILRRRAREDRVDRDAARRPLRRHLVECEDGSNRTAGNGDRRRGHGCWRVRSI